jgi:amidase
VASGLAAAAIGTETDGSITCPAAVSGLVGLKPTVGLVSRTGIIPISSSQDTAGPITLTVRDAALLLNSLAGSDPADPATKTADLHKSDYVAALEGASLKGVRVGVLRWSANFHPETEAVFDDQLARMKAAGAVLVEIDSFTTMDQINEAELTVLLTELKVGLAKYLEGSDPARVKVRSLGDIIAFNSAHADQELALFGQDTFEQAEATKGLSDPAYVRASALARRLAGPEGIDALLKTNKVEVLVAPTMGPSWLIDPVLKDHFVGGGAGTLAAVSGYPHLTVPMGKALGMPVGMSFIGPEWSEARLLRLGAAFEALQGATAMR